MSISEINEIGLSNLSLDYKTENGIGLCYFDPLDETLKEFNSDVKIPVYPKEKAVRKFYIVKDDMTLIPNVVVFRASSSSSDYIVKSFLGNSEFSFETIEKDNPCLDFFSNYPTGIIPVSIYIESTTVSLSSVVLEIELEVK